MCVWEGGGGMQACDRVYMLVGVHACVDVGNTYKF